MSTAADADSVWTVLADIREWPTWSSVCVSSNVDEEFDWKSGQRLGFRLRMAKIGVPFDVEVVSIAKGRSVSWHSTEFSITAVRTISIEDQDGGVIIKDQKSFHSPILPIGLFYPKFLINRMTQVWLAELAAESERRSAG